jgi:hypothetical protein
VGSAARATPLVSIHASNIKQTSPRVNPPLNTILITPLLKFIVILLSPKRIAKQVFPEDFNWVKSVLQRKKIKSLMYLRGQRGNG